jgi:alpha-beta hydrolase superfamily lysophospholipase
LDDAAQEREGQNGAGRGHVAGPYSIEEFTATDGYRWRYRRYPAVGAVRAELVFIHGIQSHGGWYEHSCTQLARGGFSVSFLDRRGSGLNGDARGDAPGFRRLLDDLAEFLAKIQRTAPRHAGDAMGRLPVFLAAISWGGKLAVALERRHPGHVDGLVLLCPGFFPRVYPAPGQRLKVLTARFFRPRKLFAIPLNDPELFTATPAWQRFLREDRLRLHQATARLLVESARLDAYLRFVPKYVHVPVLVLLAEHDRIIHNARTRAYVERFATPDKQIIEYPGAHHTLEFQAEESLCPPDRFIGDINTWLEQHLGN